MAKKELTPEKKQKRKGIIKYIIYAVLIIGATTLSYIKVDWTKVGPALSEVYWPWLLAAVGIAFFSYVLDALIWKVFMRLYVRKYTLAKGMAVSMIGTFYSSISAGSRGGQTMEAYTLSNQGTNKSNAASIILTNFIIYKIALMGFGLVALILRYDLIPHVGHFQLFNVIDISMTPLIIIGFIFDIFFIILLFLLAYWHGFHNFVMNKGIGLLGKIKIVRKPDETRERLRIEVENFKMELKRLFTNIPVFILILILFVGILICRFSVPFFIGASMNAFNPEKAGIDGNTFWNVCFISSYHQMVTSIIPIPGGAGTSEFFFESLFVNYFKPEYISATQIMWRSLTYYIMIPIAGAVALFYKPGAREEALKVDSKTFVKLQKETYGERKKTFEVQNQTAIFNREQLKEKMKIGLSKNKKQNKHVVSPYSQDILEKEVKNDSDDIYSEIFNDLKESGMKKKKNNQGNDWDEINIGK